MKLSPQFFFFFFFLLYCKSAKAQAGDIKFITAIRSVSDYKEDGVKGINITCRYNGLAVEEMSHNDSILEKALFTISIKLFLNDVAINPAFGYQQLANRKNEIVFTRHLLRSESEASKIDKKVDVFVPYAALKLPGLADYSITAKAEVVMEIDMESRLIQTIEKQNIAFYKPATHTASFVIDSIAVNILDTRGRAWDHSLFSSDAPDIGVEIKLANTIVWQKYFNNTYLFALPATANTISFAISEGDQVTFLIEDRDIMVSDLIATINFKSNEAKNGEWQQYIPGGGNIKACSIFFKVD
jgi:hypothetical protein